MPKIQEPTLSEHRQRLLTQILDAAELILKTQGRANLTMAAVSERAGIARNSIYRYAQNTDQLCDKVLERRLPTWSRALGQALEGLSDPAQIIAAWSRANLRQTSEHGHGWLMDLFSSSNNEHIRKSFLYGDYRRADQSVDALKASENPLKTQEPTQAMISFHHLVNGPLIAAWEQLLPGRADTGVELTRGLVQSGMRLIDALESQQPPAANTTIEAVIGDVDRSVQAVVAALTGTAS
ncbi:hypothetical protein KIMH_08740 [Bombiscardovia apis]|uniref:HTH tetR-type domain-containing protein n=1 Tax=Bombiscardovia apis TaxID=2932182 RepID=A0ABM8BCW6_9BIFI|nr:TetR/AcrR family transcriptional regulator [Bombiscardovia apis]BDR54763.1 hypothetical protein KIMH_08740 [Bombiscardovia apis]